MKKISGLLFSTFITVLGLQSNAQTAEDIIAKHIENTGGKEKIANVVSVKMDFTINIMGQEAAAKSVILVGKGSRVDMEMGGQQIIQVLNEKGGWSVNPFAGVTSPEAIPEKQFTESKDQLVFTPFLDYLAKGSKAELLGKEKLDNTEVYKINFTTADNITTTYFIDATTFYVVKALKKVTNMEQQVEMTTTFSDFRKTDYGVVVPFVSVMDYGQFAMTATVNKVEFNVPVDASVFEMKK